MRIVEIRMTSSEAERTQDFTLSVESRIGDTWRSERNVAVTSGLPEAEAKILLADNERIVIAARGSEHDLVFDKEQNAAMPRKAFESQLSPAEKQEAEDARQKELRETARTETKVNLVGDNAAERARDQAIEDAKRRHAEEVARRLETKPPVPANPNLPGKPVGLVPAKLVGGGGMIAQGPSTGGQSSKDVK